MMMLRKNRLFTPGPTPLLPAAQVAMASANFHHRTAEFRQLYTRTLAGLKEFIGTRNDVLLLACSGTGAMEAAVTNLASPGDRVLVLSAGKFGERWRDLASAFRCAVEVVSAPYGQTFDLDQVRSRLAPDMRAVFVQATESSTGARHDLQAIARLLREHAPDALLVVDAITGLGTTALDVDGWGIDVVIGGSQKALMVPPGVAYLAVSQHAWERMDRSASLRYYFDLRKERKAAANGEAAFTPPTALVAALAAALDYLRDAGQGSIAAGRDLLVENAETCAAMTRAAAQPLGLKLFAPTCPAAALTSLVPPAGIESGKIISGLREQFGAIAANGQGEMKGKLFRIAHIGYYDYMDTIGIIAALEQVLAALDAPVQMGNAVRAAQEVFAKTQQHGVTAA
jgi:aspartate aminotransferase-like enzyme